MTSDACITPEHPGLVTGLLADTDCQAFGLVERGYAALSAPGSATATAITSLMVIAVAFFGYQLMLGRGLRLADLTGLALRLGFGPTCGCVAPGRSGPLCLQPTAPGE